MDILEKLYNEENKYIEEIDRLEKRPDEVSFVEADNDSGWLCLKAAEDSFDWNIARLVGGFAEAESSIGRIPFKEYVLLVPEKTLVENSEYCKKNGSIIFFESNSGFNTVESYDYLKLNSEFGIAKSCIKTKVSPIDTRIDDIYFIMQNKIIGYCKVNKSSWHYSEIVIEISPGFRGQGFGTALLSMMVAQFRSKNVKLSYVAESDNTASLKIAKNSGLTESFVLDRYYLLKKDSFNKYKTFQLCQ